MALFPACIFFSFLIAFGACYPVTCPSLEDLTPCSCKRVGYGLRVLCTNFNDSSTLTRVFKILRDYPVQNVVLHGLYMKDILPSNLFDDMKISELRVESCKMKFSELAFNGLDSSLSVLNVAEHSTIQSANGFALARLTKLNELNVKANKLVKVTDDWLNDKIPNVHTVVLERNEISEVDGHAFAKLDQIKVISMADNRVKTVQRSMFPKPAPLLRRIDLSNNEITALPEDLFVGMPNLNEVALSGNDLQTLEKITWIPVWEQLTKVYLIDNNIMCDEQMNWLRTYRQPSKFIGNCMEPKELRSRPIRDVYIPT